MGTLDDVLGSAVPQGSLAKPLIIALGALLASGALFKSANSGAQPSKPATPQPSSQSGDLAGGLGGLLNQFQQGGLGDVMKSWIGTGQNQPISPNQLGSALGPKDHSSSGPENRYVRTGTHGATLSDSPWSCRQAHAQWPVTFVVRANELEVIKECERPRRGNFIITRDGEWRCP